MATVFASGGTVWSLSGSGTLSGAPVTVPSGQRWQVFATNGTGGIASVAVNNTGDVVVDSGFYFIYTPYAFDPNHL